MPTSILRIPSTVALTLILAGCTGGAGPSLTPASSMAVTTPIATPSPSAPTATPAIPSPSFSAQPTPKPTPVPEPPKPTGVTFREQLPVTNDGTAAKFTQTVTWRTPRTEGVEVRV